MPQTNWIYDSTIAENVSGRVSALAYSPDILAGAPGHVVTPALFVGAASGGIWRTTDTMSDNPVWTPVSDQLKESAANGQPTNIPLSVTDATGAINIGALAVHPIHPNIIYAGTGEANFAPTVGLSGAGILKSLDGGTTWELISDFSRNECVSKIIVDPTDPTGKTLYAAVVPPAVVPPDTKSPNATDGIWRSLDGGLTWSPLRQNLVVTDLDYTIVGTQLYLYAAMGDVQDWKDYPSATSGIWLSTDRGTNWQPLPLTIPPAAPNPFIGRIALAADHRLGQANPVVYAAIVSSHVSGFCSSFIGVFKTTNNGASWTDLSSTSTFPAGFSGLQGYYDLAIGVDPGNPQIVYLGGEGGGGADTAAGVLQSTDGGGSWVPIDKAGPNGQAPHVDHHAFLFVGGAVFDGNDGGVWRYSPSIPGVPSSRSRLYPN